LREVKGFTPPHSFTLSVSNLVSPVYEKGKLTPDALVIGVDELVESISRGR
jgi:hypothetical protein